LKRVLNVGGNSKSIPLPSQYDNFEKVLLDIDPRGSPDIGAVMRTTIEQAARALFKLPSVPSDLT